MNRKVRSTVLVVGLALVVALFALGLPGKAAAGQRMLKGFPADHAARPGRDDGPLLQRRLRCRSAA
jgi:hypothetical protein